MDQLLVLFDVDVLRNGIAARRLDDRHCLACNANSYYKFKNLEVLNAL